MSWETIVSICYCAVGFVGAIILLIKLYKTTKSKKAVVSILSEIPDLCKQAEELFGAGNGSAKFSWVMQNIQIKALQSNVTISNDLITKQIESTIACRNANTSKTQEVKAE